ncbi:hypothetical protein GGS23DRAFT_572378 [Durotheca rogersii]|uniref:uncharacterized protein n=1 Tax=Durotheca rogersii TaxID=419775 RepID=UPI00221EC70A|nr:uncharacterized protein GGS23DRAFT_572378 [Durotheca rogersii]KAI5862439.1 hypothetical protein GGS23DRAFT_572378 [Durotheca rogersii]
MPSSTMPLPTIDEAPVGEQSEKNANELNQKVTGSRESYEKPVNGAHKRMKFIVKNLQRQHTDILHKIKERFKKLTALIKCRQGNQSNPSNPSNAASPPSPSPPAGCAIPAVNERNSNGEDRAKATNDARHLVADDAQCKARPTTEPACPKAYSGAGPEPYTPTGPECLPNGKIDFHRAKNPGPGSAEIQQEAPHIFHSPLTEFATLLPIVGESLVNFMRRIREAYYRLSSQDRESRLIRELLLNHFKNYAPSVWLSLVDHIHQWNTDQVVEKAVCRAEVITHIAVERKIYSTPTITTQLRGTAAPFYIMKIAEATALRPGSPYVRLLDATDAVVQAAKLPEILGSRCDDG